MNIDGREAETIEKTTEMRIAALKNHCDQLLTEKEMNERELLNSVRMIDGNTPIKEAFEIVQHVLDEYELVKSGVIEHW